MDRLRSVSFTPCLVSGVNHIFPALLIVAGQPRIAPIFTPLEWRELAHACQVVAAKERARAAEIAGSGARGFLISAETFERLAEQCFEMTRPAYE